MTAFGDLDTAVRAVNAGAFDYLVKPFDLESVSRIVAHALAESGQRAAAGANPPAATVADAEPAATVPSATAEDRGEGQTDPRQPAAQPPAAAPPPVAAQPAPTAAVAVDPADPWNLDLKAAAPLLCAGITTYSPLKQWNCKPGDKVAVLGLGGLGHMAVKLAAAMGAEVTVLSSSKGKEADAKRLGAAFFESSTEGASERKLKNRFNLIIDCVSADHSFETYLQMLAPFGALVLVGAPPKPSEVGAFSLIHNNRRLAGSSIGGIRQTQEMLDFCGKHNITSMIEVIKPD
jgi:hypothetical protein